MPRAAYRLYWQWSKEVLNNDGPEDVVIGQLWTVFGNLLKGLSGRKIIGPGSYKVKTEEAAIRCTFKTDAGFLYPLDKAFLYLVKPKPLHIRFSQIVGIEFERTQSKQQRTFDIRIETSEANFEFHGLARTEYEPVRVCVAVIT